MNYVTHKQLEDFCTKHSKLKPTIDLAQKKNPFSLTEREILWTLATKI